VTVNKSVDVPVMAPRGDGHHDGIARSLAVADGRLLLMAGSDHVHAISCRLLRGSDTLAVPFASRAAITHMRKPLYRRVAARYACWSRARRNSRWLADDEMTTKVPPTGERLL
jgi:hypothetical protein